MGLREGEQEQLDSTLAPGSTSPPPAALPGQAEAAQEFPAT